MSHFKSALTNVIKQQCVVLHLPTVGSQCVPLAEQAERERQPYLGYLEALFAAELEDRERRAIERRIKEAHLPRVKTLDEFDFRQAPTVSPTRLSELAEGSYIERAEPVVFIGDSGTGKTHLLTALCVAACRQRRRGRFTTAAALVNELVEAKQQLQLRRVLARWARYDVIAIDEVGYGPLAELGAEFLFQVISDRAEQAAVLLTTNLPFSEWTQVIPNTRLCKALLDRITDREHIIETGSDSYRFRRTLELRGRHARSTTDNGVIHESTANVDATLWLLDEVMSIVWRKRPDVHLYVVGRSPAPAIVARAGPRVHVTGEVPSIVPYMSASAAALVPLRWESGTRFKILEAFACKTPVVSTTLGAEGLEVEHGQHLLLADDPQSFAGAILSLVDDAAIGQRLVGPAYDLVRREYDLSSAERQITAVLSRLGFAATLAPP